MWYVEILFLKGSSNNIYRVLIITVCVFSHSVLSEQKNVLYIQ